MKGGVQNMSPHKKTNRRIAFSSLADYPVVGSGKDGKVYRLSQDKCIKVYYDETTQQQELKALELGQVSSIVPVLYESGHNYTVMEYIHAISLSKYIKEYNRLPSALVERILLLFDEMKAIGFTRWDAEVRHILITDATELKVIDLKRSLTSTKSIPTKLFQGLRKLGALPLFLRRVQTLRPDLYKEWVRYQ